MHYKTEYNDFALSPLGCLWYLGNIAVDPGAFCVEEGWSRIVIDENGKKFCPDCEQMLPATREYFYFSPVNKDRFVNRCIPCHKKYQSARWRKKHPKEEEEPVPEGYKRCTGCKNTFPETREYFQAERKGKFWAKCKTCKNAYDTRLALERAKKHPPVFSEDVKKVCTGCGKEWPATPKYFATRTRVKDGLEAECKKCKSDRAKELQSRKPEEIRQQKTLYREENRETLRAKGREYAKTHKAERNAAWHRREAKKRDLPGDHTDDDERRQHERQKLQCHYCGIKLPRWIPNQKKPYEADHIIPITREGSSNGPENIVITCKFCNGSKGDRLPHEWYRGGHLL